MLTEAGELLDEQRQIARAQHHDRTGQQQRAGLVHRRPARRDRARGCCPRARRRPARSSRRRPRSGAARPRRVRQPRARCAAVSTPREKPAPARPCQLPQCAARRAAERRVAPSRGCAAARALRAAVLGACDARWHLRRRSIALSCGAPDDEPLSRFGARSRRRLCRAVPVCGDSRCRTNRASVHESQRHTGTHRRAPVLRAAAARARPLSCPASGVSLTPDRR